MPDISTLITNIYICICNIHIYIYKINRLEIVSLTSLYYPTTVSKEPLHFFGFTNFLQIFSKNFSMSPKKGELPVKPTFKKSSGLY